MAGRTMKTGQRVETPASADLRNNPFAALDSGGFPVAETPSKPKSPEVPPGGRKAPNMRRGRVDVIRQTAGRGGKTVTVLKGFKGISEREMLDLTRALQRSCGVGGTFKQGTIEIQGDQRERAIAVLTQAGFQPVRAGG